MGRTSEAVAPENQPVLRYQTNLRLLFNALPN